MGTAVVVLAAQGYCSARHHICACADRCLDGGRNGSARYGGAKTRNQTDDRARANCVRVRAGQRGQRYASNSGSDIRVGADSRHDLRRCRCACRRPVSADDATRSCGGLRIGIGERLAEHAYGTGRMHVQRIRSAIRLSRQSAWRETATSPSRVGSAPAMNVRRRPPGCRPSSLNPPLRCSVSAAARRPGCATGPRSPSALSTTP